MTEHEAASLPHVDEIDLAEVLLEDILDPTHRKRWALYAENNPELMREVLIRADALAQQANSRFDISKGSIDLAMWVMEALETAMRRTSNDGDGGEGRRL